jgi:hypothetical protein
MSVGYKTAIALANDGFAVFPVQANSKYPYKGCEWMEMATTDPSEVKELFKIDRPNSNIAIATGEPSGGILVVDVDVKKGAKGFESLRKLQKEIGCALPKTWEVSTPSGGKHIYFETDATKIKNSVNVRPGIDIRHTGGYVLAPRSEIDGRKYEWRNRDREIAELPKELLEILQTGGSKQHAADKSDGKIDEGSRNNELTSLAGSLRHRGLDAKAILRTLRAYNEENCNPPLPESELKTISASIGTKPAGEAAETFEIAKHLESVSMMLKRDIEPVRYLFDGLLARGGTSILGGPPKGLKSTLALYIALAGVGAIEFGWDKFNPTANGHIRVGYLDLEQADPLFLERLNQFEPDKLALKRLYRVDAFPKFDAQGIEHLERLIKDKKLDLVIVDTLARVRPPSRGKGASEADAELLDPVTKVAHRTGCHVLIVAHNGKRKDHDNPIEMLAATSALAGAVDDVMILSKPQGGETELRRNLFITGRHIREPGTYLIDRTQDGFDFIGEASDVIQGELQRKVLAFLRSERAPNTPTNIGKAVGTNRIGAQKAIGKLVARNLIVSCGDGKYTLPEYSISIRSRK